MEDREPVTHAREFLARTIHFQTTGEIPGSRRCGSLPSLDQSTQGLVGYEFYDVEFQIADEKCGHSLSFPRKSLFLQVGRISEQAKAFRLQFYRSAVYLVDNLSEACTDGLGWCLMLRF